MIALNWHKFYDMKYNLKSKETMLFTSNFVLGAC